MQYEMHHDISLFQDMDTYLFRQGTHYRLYEKLGCHRVRSGNREGVYFAVWAPNASRVSLVADFNDWNGASHPLQLRPDESGIWEGFVPGLPAGHLYKYRVESGVNDYWADKTDPFGFYCESTSSLASVVWDLEYDWQDREWMQNREESNSLRSPHCVYECHLGSWARGENDRFLGYREIAPLLAEYLLETGFTHVELLPVMEHPFYGSWGYQTLGYFAPTARYGTPQDFMYLVDYLHNRGIGVFLDWVPSHFPGDETGLVYFDGTHLFEHQDSRLGFHPDWKSYIFNYGRNEVHAFLISSALFWLDKYHVDGLRVDAVASLLYLDYGRSQGDWIPNRYGGNENLDAIAFLRNFNCAVYESFPGAQTIAEESTSWPMVSRPAYAGGLGFGMKWNMGWMHDTLDYFSRDSIFRKYHHSDITFSIWYAFTENFVLPLSHDEVVHEKGSLLEKMPGDDWQKFANLRLMLGYMYTHPGKKLLFMGGEFGQRGEWSHEESLHWHLLQEPMHSGLAQWIKDLNMFYRSEPCLYATDFDPAGFAWIDHSDWEQSVISYLRRSPDRDFDLAVVCNNTPLPRPSYRIGVPRPGLWQEVLNSDAREYCGSGWGNLGGARTSMQPCHGFRQSLTLNLPPLGLILLKYQENAW